MRLALVAASVVALAACAHDDPKISADRAREVGASSAVASTSASASIAPVPSPLRDPFAPDAK